MHARELVELAALVAAHGPTLIQDDVLLSDSAVEQYWAASKCRLDRWCHRLSALAADNRLASRSDSKTSWPTDRAVLEEIFSGELLVRVFSAVAAAYDRRRCTEQIDPVTRSILLGHLETRNRALRLLVQDGGIPAEEAMRLDRLRRRVERWTDMLVGLVADDEDLDTLAIDAQRARDFGEDLHYRRRIRGVAQAWPLLTASLRSAFQQSLSPESPNGDLNGRIAAAVLACFPSDLFDATGTFRSLWMVRLAHGADDAQWMMDSLLGAPASSSRPSSPLNASPLDSPPNFDLLLDRLRRFGTR